MNLQQLEYIIAVDKHRHFATAAGACFVTQPTLSMMIHKLEEELGLRIFDRSKQPVQPTREGAEIIRKARAVLSRAKHLKEYAGELKGDVAGDVQLGIIPTLAPYLLPLFLKSFHSKYPGLRIFIREMITGEIVEQLHSGKLDIGLCAIPVRDPELTGWPLFYEEFFVYASREERLPRKKYLLPGELNTDHLWLLEEGHCLRNQVFNLCGLKKRDNGSLNYEAGSIETLINLVDQDQGMTIIPKLAELKLKAAQKKNIREFASPRPAREIGLLVSRNFPRARLLQVLREEILNSIPDEMKDKKQKKVARL